MIEGNENLKTTLEDDASIYAKRDTRDAKAKFKDLKGEEKWQFFKDYILMKLIGIIIGVVCLGLFLYSVLSPKATVMYNVAVLDSPFSSAALETINAGMQESFITDSDKQTVTFDTDYYVSADNYNTRSKLMTFIAAGDIDCMIMPMREFENYAAADIYADLYSVLTPEELRSIEDLLVYHAYYTGRDDADSQPIFDTENEYCCAINITSLISKLNSAEPSTEYVMVCLANTKHTDSFMTMYRVLAGE